MDVTKPYKFLGFGAMAVTKLYKFYRVLGLDLEIRSRGPPGAPSLVQHGCTLLTEVVTVLGLACERAGRAPISF